MRFHTPREFYIPKGSMKVADKASGAVAYLHTNPRGHVCAVFFAGKSDKPLAHYRYGSPEKRERAVREFFENARSAVARKDARRTERKAFVHDYQVGDILNTCWGYDQTNREFFEVVEVKGKFLILREVAQAREDTGWLQGKCAPQSGSYIGEPIRRLAGQYGVKIDEVRTAHRWNTQNVAGVPMGPALVWTAYH